VKQVKIKNLGTIFVFISAVLFSMGGLFVKLVPWQPLSINGARSIYAAIIIFTYIKLTKHKIVFNKYVALGAVATASTSILYIIAIKLTTAANAILLQYTMPIFIIVYMWIFMKVRPKRVELISCIFILIGMVFFFGSGLSGKGMLGNICAVLSGAFLSIIYMANVMPNSDSMSSAFFGHVLGVVISAPFILFETDFSGTVLLNVSILGIFQLGLAYVFLVKGLKTTPPVKASLVSTIEPILNPILVAVFYGEYLSSTSLIGAVIVVATITIYNITSGKNR